MALLQWLGENQDETVVLKADSGNLRISLKPIQFSSNVGIDEDSLPKLEPEDETEVLEENAEVDEDEATGAE
jgi:hypothetical protein